MRYATNFIIKKASCHGVILHRAFGQILLIKTNLVASCCTIYSTCFSTDGSVSNTVYSNNSKKVKELLREWMRTLQAHNISEPKESLEHIFAHVLGSRSISTVYKCGNKILSPFEVQQINKYCEQRLERVPVQYIIKEWDFRDLTLKMSPPVFIPRPETEMLVDIVLNEINRKEIHQALEFCCGSGAISIALLKQCPHLNMVAIDKSKEACALTELNATLHGVRDRLKIIPKGITDSSANFEAVTKQYGVIVSNPPYIFEQDMLNLQPEINLYEDPDALNGGADGLKVIKYILKASSQMLKCDGRLFLEVDPKHPPLIKRWLEEHPCLQLQMNRVYKDFYGKNRFVEVVNNTYD